MKPPPPRLPASGQVTARANAVATAASTAFPPCLRMLHPTADASGDTETTIPFRPSAVRLPDSAPPAGTLLVRRTHIIVADILVMLDRISSPVYTSQMRKPWASDCSASSRRRGM